MTAKGVVARARAEQDVNDALDFYLGQASQRVVLGFIDALERAYRLIGERPEIGATRYAYELDLPGVRSWPLRDYPYVVSTFRATTMSTSGASCTRPATYLRG